MRRAAPAPVLLLLCAALAGCAGQEDRSGGDRDDNLFLNLRGEGVWSARFPLPQDDGVDVTAWSESLRVSIGTATWGIEDAGDGSVLRVDGEDFVALEALSSQVNMSCCAESFQDALWSDGGGTVEERARVEVLAGTLGSVGFGWTSVSCVGDGCRGDAGPAWVCSQEVRWDGDRLGPGPHRLEVRRSLVCA